MLKDIPGVGNRASYVSRESSRHSPDGSHNSAAEALRAKYGTSHTSDTPRLALRNSVFRGVYRAKRVDSINLIG